MRKVHCSIAVLAVVGLVSIAGLVTAGAGIAASAAGQANTQTYTDPAGDGGAGPDLGAITVSNDDAGVIAFRVAVSNRTALAPTDVILVFLDSDGSTSTGYSGIDYVAAFIGPFPVMFRMDSSGSLQPTTLPSFSGSYSGGTGTFSVNGKDIAAGSVIRFFAVSSADALVSRSDDAPDSGSYLYAVNVSSAPLAAPATPAAPVVRAAPKRLTLKASSLRVSSATAGAPFTIGMQVTRSDTSTSLTLGTIACSAVLAGKPLPARSKGFRGGLAGCTWLIPVTARGKVVRGTITVTYNGSSVKRSFSARVS